MVVGVGFRTNHAAVGMLQALMAEIGVEVVAVPVGSGVQHLLGVVVLIDEDLAVVRADAATGELRQLLRAQGIGCIDIDTDDELLHHHGMNMVVLAPRRVMMSDAAPRLRGRLEARGIEAEVVNLTETARAAGGLGCLTGILRRES